MSKITDSARNEDCTIRLPGICTFDPAKTIWSHARWGRAGKGRSIKPMDLCGAYACTACDAAYDQLQGAKAAGLTRAQIDADWMMGHLESLVKLRAKGLV